MDEPADFCTNPPLSPGGFVQGQVSKLPINCQEVNLIIMNDVCWEKRKEKKKPRLPVELGPPPESPHRCLITERENRLTWHLVSQTWNSIFQELPFAPLPLETLLRYVSGHGIVHQRACICIQSQVQKTLQTKTCATTILLRALKPEQSNPRHSPTRYTICIHRCPSQDLSDLQRRSNHSLTTVSRRRKYQQRSIYSDPTPLMHAVRADQPQVVRFSTGVVCGG
ncbi:uncharacterized protein PADG_02571 [Paracoccidioides brasiliensis Pb18]|uniref:Uncharacterized protein n=1 Tax=Paracoccidioides brasiliensis (strain Pb18) TaxID=502780 RepID=C1G5W6_PARBD|nr:uncharacterized protein PADG_02571 [Paracoccidioides brasiliensis Pb18]EEH46473.2 hypothetical protein PADG_02571 [Paracoccidioides brasiliensis Pb18]